MLVLSRRVGEKVLLSSGVVVKVLAVRGQQVRLGFEAPEEVQIWREEISWADRPIYATSIGAERQAVACIPR
jgi:carbon storage regulator